MRETRRRRRRRTKYNRKNCATINERKKKQELIYIYRGASTRDDRAETNRILLI